MDGASTFVPLFHKGLLVVVAEESVYLLGPTNGKLRQHFQWKGESMAIAEGTRRAEHGSLGSGARMDSKPCHPYARFGLSRFRRSP